MTWCLPSPSCRHLPQGCRNPATRFSSERLVCGRESGGRPQQDSNLVVLAGDTHNAWANNLRDIDGRQIGVEFATASVTSPGLEGYLGLPAEMIPQAEQGIGLLVDDLDYLDISQRGYMLVTFTPEHARADWYFVDTVKSRDYEAGQQPSASRQVLPGEGQRSLQLLSS
ncbi:alkaline phosphatase D family protein [Marinobacter shengliensis]|uniref:alkaline phosphatase D family protein n=1 Tax=Marinobacter shengliensis TaxID=1389223 RepID=UPI002E7B6538|nr:alkaline phosphatase D family protein [Marinobacter shengliensis]MCD1628664.1 alkaline phosphatase D family protein [Marinobacter shengliensis]